MTNNDDGMLELPGSPGDYLTMTEGLRFRVRHPDNDTRCRTPGSCRADYGHVTRFVVWNPRLGLGYVFYRDREGSSRTRTDIRSLYNPYPLSSWGELGVMLGRWTACADILPGWGDQEPDHVPEA